MLDSSPIPSQLAIQIGDLKVVSNNNVLSSNNNSKLIGKAIEYGRVKSNSFAGVSLADHELKFDVGVCMGTRRQFEDRWSVDLSEDRNAAVFGVFDGHNGDQAADHLRANLGPSLLAHPLILSDPKAAIAEVFHAVDASLVLLQSSSFRRQAGSTAVVVLVVKDKLYIAHVGDSRCTVISTQSKVLALTAEHRASRRVERARILGLGGRVEPGADGLARVEGVLQVSRAFGHAKLKQFIRADPDILECHLSEVKCVVLATDGLHDLVDNPSVVRVTESESPFPAEDLVGLARNKKVSDNVCAMVIRTQMTIKNECLVTQ